MIGRLLVRILNAQSGWARPFGDFNHRWLSALFRPIKPIKSFLNGTWLGHSIHAALTDIPIGVFTLAIIFDLFDQRTAADWAVGFGVAGDGGRRGSRPGRLHRHGRPPTHGRHRPRHDHGPRAAGLSRDLLAAAGNAARGSHACRSSVGLLGYGLVTAGAWVGGEAVYALGNMVNRHAWRFSGSAKWTRLDVTEVPEGKPTKAKAGAQSLVLVRQGSTIYALHDQCAHAGGPLSEGRVVDGCIECPWHQSCYDLATGRRKSGPTTFDQPNYQVREAEGGGWEVLRLGAGTGQNI